ncbi:MAG: DUF1320 domain-containing protein [Deltaproteobacteria bacterium]|nr:DUF1320 domain-containing protein [Deltaproteobacteria bacterium]MBV8454032.1 DUF1320 domain-containing protein [Deltaproteobacteria bacterium]
MSYAAISDIESRYPPRDLIQLTNEVVPLILTFSGNPGTIQLPFGNLSALLYVQSALSNPVTYVLGTDYSVDSTAGIITRIGTGSVAAGATVYVSADNTGYLQTFLNDASNEIDTYLESRFALPLSDPPSVLVQFCCKIAMYHLQGLRPIRDLAYAKEQYEQVINQLEAVRDRSLTLGLSGDGQEPADPASPAVVTVQNFGNDPALPQRIFSRGTLKGF